MLVIGSEIHIIRGDDGTILVKRQDAGGNSMPFSQDDRLVMTVRQDGCPQNDPLLSIEGEIQDGEGLFVLPRDEIAELPFGTFAYDVQHTDVNGMVTTLVNNPLDLHLL